MSIKESQNPKFNFQIKDDIEAARRRLLRRIIYTLKKPTTQPTKIALLSWKLNHIPSHLTKLYAAIPPR
jgi:hypothetical protein